MKTINNILINTIICALMLGACGLAAFAQQKENTFQITITEPKQIEDFVAKNQKFLQIEKRSWDERVLANKTNFQVPGIYRQEFLKASGIADKDIVCDSGYINYSGDFFPLNEITKIKITKTYRRNGFRRLSENVLYYDISLKGKSGARETSIPKKYMKAYAGKKIHCYKETGAEQKRAATPAGFTYPQELYIPSAALAQNQLQESLGADTKQLASNENTAPAIQVLQNQAALI